MSFARKLTALLLGGALVRVAYLLTQRRFDPAFDRPQLDGEYYLDWARALAGGGAPPEGAYYMAPLFPHALSLLLRAFGENFIAIHVAQHLVMLMAAGLLAAAAVPTIGRRAALAAVLLFLSYQPLLFFAARPVGEPLAVMLLLLGLFFVGRSSPFDGFCAGASIGLASLARPNLLLVAACWVACEVGARRSTRAALLVAGTALVLAPVTWRNFAASGHFVPISSNFGITAYQGNAPGARGTYTRPLGLSGAPAEQRGEATTIARLRSHLALDPVQADRWWAREALRQSLCDPLASARLLLRRALLLFGDTEHGMDDHPLVDDNPWRLTLRFGSGAAPSELLLVPFALLLGLSAFSLAREGIRGSGGWHVWSAMVACAAMPLVFYVSSRYRLPLASLLVLPAGRGLATLLQPGHRDSRFKWALVVGLGCAVGSLVAPGRDLLDAERSAALVNRASLYLDKRDPVSAMRDVRRALQYQPLSPAAHFALGVIAANEGQPLEAQRTFQRVLELDPTHPGAAGNLAVLLLAAGAPGEAVPHLRRALSEYPTHVACWKNLVLCLRAQGDPSAARDAVRQAANRGIPIDAAPEEVPRSIEE